MARSSLLRGWYLPAQQACDETLIAILLDILREAGLVRPHDPVRAAHLDDAPNDLRMVIAAKER